MLGRENAYLDRTFPVGTVSGYVREIVILSLTEFMTHGVPFQEGV